MVASACLVLSLLTVQSEAAFIAHDDFSGYVGGPIAGQDVTKIGFTGPWFADGTSANVAGGAMTGGFGGRTYRAFDPTVSGATGTVDISFVATLPTVFSGIELSPDSGGSDYSIRICTSGSNLVIQGKNDSEQNVVLYALDDQPHSYSIKLNVGTKSGWARIDAEAYQPFAFTNLGTTPFALNYLKFADFSGNSAMTLDNFQISAVPEPGSMLGLGCLIGAGALLRTRRRHG